MAAPTTIDEYLRALPADQRRALASLRAQIRAAAPAVEEYIGYGLAGFKLHGRPLMYMGAAKNHCAIYGARADDVLADKLKAYKQSKGTIQFTPDKPIPATIVKQLVKARVAALEARKEARKKTSAKRKVAARKTRSRVSAKKTPQTVAARSDTPRDRAQVRAGVLPSKSGATKEFVARTKELDAARANPAIAASMFIDRGSPSRQGSWGWTS